MLYALSNNGDSLSHDYWQDSGEGLVSVTSRSAARSISEAKADIVTSDVLTPASQRGGYVGDSSTCEAKNLVILMSFKALQLRMCRWTDKMHNFLQTIFKFNFNL